MTNELQQDFQYSSQLFHDKHGDSIGYLNNKRDLIVSQGKFALVESSLAHCPITDGVLGHFPIKVLEFNSREEAEEYCHDMDKDGDGYDFEIFPKLKYVRSVEQDELPF